jgi:hypothetical protein
MTIIAETILSISTHPQDNTIQSLIGSRYRGDGFYNRSDGLHTVQWSITNFTGVIAIQATLETDPGDLDWFTVNLGNSTTYSIDTTGLLSQSNIKSMSYTTPTTGSFSYNFKGNYVWVRAFISNWSSGTINQILMSH